MTRIFFAMTMVLAVAACSTINTATQEMTTHATSAYNFTTNIEGIKNKSLNEAGSVKTEPRLGFSEFSGSHTLWGAN